jgi:hypothetical protein
VPERKGASPWPEQKETLLKAGQVLALMGLAFPAGAQYAGPAILTRGEVPVAMSAPQMHFRPFLEVTGIYDTGLATVALTDKGGLANQTSYGVAIAWGISGAHSWRHTRIGLEYRGSVSHYAQSSGFDSLDQSLLLGINRQLARHVMFSLHTSAGIFSRDFEFAGLPQTVSFDPTTTNIPTADFFDNRTMYVNTIADLILQKSARLSFDLGGGGSIVRRRSTALDGSTSANAHGDLQYRISRRATIGATYSYDHFDFTRILGGTDVHSGIGTFALQLTRRVEFTGYAGFSRAESRFIPVPIDPVIVALLGITQETPVVHTTRYVPNASGRLSRAFQRGVAYVAGGHTVDPGNGLFLTSYTTTVLGGYTYTGIRRWSFGTQVNYGSSRSIGNILGTYSDIGGRLSASRQILPSVHFIATYAARQYDSRDFTNYNRLVHEGRIGLGWSPGDVPLRIW